MLSLRTSSIGVALAVSVLAIGCSGSGSDATGAPATTTAPASTTTASTTTVAPTIPAGREVEIHVPPGYQDGTPAPLLILLHGFGADGKIQSGYLGLQKATDAAGMLYVYPDGVMGRQGKRSWNATGRRCRRE